MKQTVVSGTPRPDLTTLADLQDHELAPGTIDPTQFVVLGLHEFVLGRVRRLVVSRKRQEVVYLVVSTATSNFRDSLGEERLVPAAWASLVPHRRQAVLPHLTPMGFRCLPIYHAGGTIPDQIDFPAPHPDEVAYWDIA